jgi:hypothetical protein
VSPLVGVAGAIAAVIAAIVAGWFSVRGSRAAARISTAPQSKQVDLSVLLSSVERLKEECNELRQEQTRTRGILWSISRWALRLRDQVTEYGGTPEPPPQDVEDYYRTGV